MYEFSKSSEITHNSDHGGTESCAWLLSDYVNVSLLFHTFPEAWAHRIFCVSSLLHKIDALRWTPHMNECLQEVDERRECLTDEILAQQVRLQVIVEKVTLGTWNDGAMETD